MPNLTLLQLAPGWLVTLFVFIFIIIFYFIGHFVRVKRHLRNPALAQSDSSKMSTVLIGLLGFLMAFTFGMSNSRYDKRRMLIVEEANDIGTAFLRTKVYPDSLQKLFTPVFNEYLETRIAFCSASLHNISDLETLWHYYEKADSIGKNIWTIAVSLSKTNAYLVTASQLLPAVNAMIDITVTRREAGESTVPDSILYFLFVLAFCSAFLLGYEIKGKVDPIILFVFAIMISTTIFTIIDLDRPRAGFIKMDAPLQKMIELRSLIN